MSNLKVKDVAKTVRVHYRNYKQFYDIYPVIKVFIYLGDYNKDDKTVKLIVPTNAAQHEATVAKFCRKILSIETEEMRIKACEQYATDLLPVYKDLLLFTMASKKYGANHCIRVAPKLSVDDIYGLKQLFNHYSVRHYIRYISPVIAANKEYLEWHNKYYNFGLKEKSE